MLTFKIKVEDRSRVRLPQIRRSHMEDLNALRCHPNLGGLINSTLGEAAVSRYVHNVLKVPRVFDFDNLPSNVSIEEGFLTTIHIRDEVAI